MYCGEAEFIFCVLITRGGLVNFRHPQDILKAKRTQTGIGPPNRRD